MVPVASTPPRAAYVHVPFCAHRCGYCNFTVVAGRDDLIGAYLAALQRELSWLGAPRPVETLFLGGGTPTHLPPADLDRLLELVARWFPLLPGGEWTIEANPADLSPARIAVLRQYPIDRVSLGAQSLDAQRLVLLQRDHTPDDVRRAVQAARSFARSVSLDLIFACPGETLAQWQRGLQRGRRCSATEGPSVTRGLRSALGFNGAVAVQRRKVDAEDETVLTLAARKVEEKLGGKASLPSLLSVFPPEGRKEHSEAFIARNFLG